VTTPAVWQVPSHTRPDVVHRVTLNADGLLTCSCEASQYGRLCRHRISVIHEHLQELIMPSFNPADHLIKLQGRDYLEVKWRLVWLREVHPDATIITEILNHNPAEEWCVVRATVVIPNGGSATGMALQRPTKIAVDYVANCETSAIGRALGALGFGTQFAPEFDQGTDVVDSPVARPAATSVASSTDPELEAARAALKAAMKAHDWSLLRVIETAGWIWSHVTSATAIGTLTPVQLTRLTEVVTGESVIHLDVHGVRRIMPAEVVGMVS
jgi:hypothetical protein